MDGTAVRGPASGLRARPTPRHGTGRRNIGEDRVNDDTRGNPPYPHALRRRGGAPAGVRLTLAFVVTLALSACAPPGPTPTISPADKTAVAVVPARTPTRATTPARTPGAVAGSGGAAAKPTLAPKREVFQATVAEPCRTTDVVRRPIPEGPATLDTIGSAYRCLLKYHVERHTFDHRILLQGAWAALDEARPGLFAPGDLAPLELAGDREADWDHFAARYGTLVAKYGGRAEGSKLARGAIEDMAESMRDNHVAYLEPKRWGRSITEYLGLDYLSSAGFEVLLDKASGKFYLYHVYPRSPAAEAGLRAGDIIETVGGRPMGRGKNNRALGDLLAGPPGTGNTVRVTRPATGRTIEVTVGVAEIEIPLMEVRILQGEIGYIKLRNFSYNAGAVFDEALAALERRGITSLIFDVRQNPGGSVDALLHIVSHFTHQGPIGITIDENGTREEAVPDLSVPLLRIPYVVLCDGDSASSADVTAAVAKDRGGHLVGEKSAGALSTSRYFDLEDGSALQISVQRVLGPDGEEINEVGVTPHHVVPLTPADLSAGVDTQLQHAIQDLTRR